MRTYQNYQIYQAPGGGENVEPRFSSQEIKALESFGGKLGLTISALGSKRKQAQNVYHGLERHETDGPSLLQVWVLVRDLNFRSG